VTTIHHGLDVSGPGGLGSGSADKTQAAAGQTQQSQTQAPAGTVSQSAEVQITPTAQLLATLEQQIASTPDVNQSRVDSIRQALSDGSYRIDSSRVADGLLAAQKFDAQATKVSGSGAQATTARAFADTARHK
jgi:negative regulator of flagellin synthesis FlgM